jgi:hypothetical protein
MDEKLYATYQRVEQNHWWFTGRRQLIFQTLKRFSAEQRPTGRREPVKIIFR